VSRLRIALLILFVAIILGGFWLLWVKPKTVDMAGFAPAGSLLYLEANRPADIADALASTGAAQLLNREASFHNRGSNSGWLRKLVWLTGLGPIESVILARAQVALVVIGAGVAEEAGDSINVRPEAALIIETHTSERRIRATIEGTLRRLAERTYGKATTVRVEVDGLKYVKWENQDGSRRIVAAFIGSVVIIGNNQGVVQNCANVARRREPSLRDDPSLHRARADLGARDSLAFGYAPAKGTAHLLALGVPLLLGQTPGDSEFQGLLAKAGAKMIGNLAWSSRPFKNGIEDRYLIALQPTVTGQLKPAFNTVAVANPLRPPPNAHSFSRYRFENPLSAWENLKTTTSSHVDTLSAVVLNSLLKSALLPFGIDVPEDFLRGIKGEALTARFDEQGEQQLLVAHIHDRRLLQDFVSKRFTRSKDSAGNLELFESADQSITAVFSDSLFAIGDTVEVRRYAQSVLTSMTTDVAKSGARLTAFSSPSPQAHIITLTDDTERVRTFLAAMRRLNSNSTPDNSTIDQGMANLPFAYTETTLGNEGFERVTRSPLGQFATLVPMLVPETTSPRSGP
jgi:hypothetical protein